MLDEDLSASKKSPGKRRKSGNGVAYDDVYTRKENCEKQTSATVPSWSIKFKRYCHKSKDSIFQSWSFDMLTA